MTNFTDKPERKRSNNWADKLRRTSGDLIINEDVVSCLFCNYTKKHDSKQGIAQYILHLNTPKHLALKEAKQDSDRKFEEGLLNKDMLQESFTKMLVDCNIPFRAIEQPSAKEFFRLLSFDLKSKHYYSDKVLNKLAEEQAAKLYSLFINKDIYVLTDETTNVTNESVLHVFIGKLEKKTNIANLNSFYHQNC